MTAAATAGEALPGRPAPIGPRVRDRIPTPGRGGRHPIERPAHRVPVRERGAVTAELAVVLPAVVVVLLAVLLAASAGIAQIRCVDAARASARAAAIGDEPSRVHGIAAELAGPDAAVSVTSDGEWVAVEVVRAISIGDGWEITVSGSARAWVEPGAPP